jgi:hypothetical protein
MRFSDLAQLPERRNGGARSQSHDDKSATKAICLIAEGGIDPSTFMICRFSSGAFSLISTLMALGCSSGAPSGQPSANSGSTASSGAATSSGESQAAAGVATPSSGASLSGSDSTGGNAAGQNESGSSAGSGNGGGTPSAGNGDAQKDSGLGGDAEQPVDGGLGSSGSTGGMLPAGKQSLIWVWENYASALQSVTGHATSFTHVSPALYQLNYGYASGVAQLVNSNDDFGGGLTSQSIAQAIHAARLKCVPLMYAGAGNSGTDQGIQNVLNDSPAGAQSSFITSMVGEAMKKGYDGYNLDWEVGNTGSDYGGKLVSFLSAFKSALNKQGMELSLDVAGWYISQCSAAGGPALVDLTKIGPSVDLAIIEDYAGMLGGPVQTCASATAGNSQDCGDSNFVSGLNVMCNLPPNAVSIGIIYSANNGGADTYTSDALNAVSAYKYQAVAVWPDDFGFYSQQSWYTALAMYLAN